MNPNLSKTKKETVVLLCVLLVCILITLVLLITLINTSKKEPVSQVQDPQYIEIDPLAGINIADAKAILDGAQISYEIIPTDSKIPNRVENIEFWGKTQENGKLLVEIGTTVKLYSNEVAQDKIIYLTFDDGPIVNYKIETLEIYHTTDEILDILEEYGIKATFYLIGDQMVKSDRVQYVGEIYNRGHLIACHSFSHVFDKIYSSTENLILEIEQFENELKSILGEQIYNSLDKYFRFPGGSSGLEQEYIDSVRNKGYKIHDWAAETKDKNGCSTTEEFIHNLSIELPRARNNNIPLIVLMHDMDSTKNSLPAILDYLISEGYYFDTIDNCPEYIIAENQ